MQDCGAQPQHAAIPRGFPGCRAVISAILHRTLVPLRAHTCSNTCGKLTRQNTQAQLPIPQRIDAVFHGFPTLLHRVVHSWGRNYSAVIHAGFRWNLRVIPISTCALRTNCGQRRWMSGVNVWRRRPTRSQSPAGGVRRPGGRRPGPTRNDRDPAEAAGGCIRPRRPIRSRPGATNRRRC